MSDKMDWVEPPKNELPLPLRYSGKPAEGDHWLKGVLATLLQMSPTGPSNSEIQKQLVTGPESLRGQVGAAFGPMMGGLLRTMGATSPGRLNMWVGPEGKTFDTKRDADAYMTLLNAPESNQQITGRSVDALNLRLAKDHGVMLEPVTSKLLQYQQDVPAAKAINVAPLTASVRNTEKLQREYVVPLQAVFDDPNLFAAYPSLKGRNIVFDPSVGKGAGSFSPTTGNIRVGTKGAGNLGEFDPEQFAAARTSARNSKHRRITWRHVYAKRPALREGY